MTKYPELSVEINGQTIQWEEIYRHKVQRAVHALSTIDELGGQLVLNQQTLSSDRLSLLSNEELLAADKETKLSLGTEKILSLFQDQLEESDDRIRRTVAISDGDQNFKKSEIVVNVKGITPDFVKNFGLMGSKVDESAAFDIHPEYYDLQTLADGQRIMETVGEYKTPTLAGLSMEDPKKFLPGKVDPHAAFVLVARGYLWSDKSDMHQWAMHQFIPTADGLKLIAGLYCPSKTPDEMMIGHRWHFAVEFGSLFSKFLDQQHAAKK